MNEKQVKSKVKKSTAKKDEQKLAHNSALKATAELGMMQKNSSNAITLEAQPSRIKFNVTANTTDHLDNFENRPQSGYETGSSNTGKVSSIKPRTFHKNEPENSVENEENEYNLRVTYIKGDMTEKEINSLHPHANKQAILDIIRFACVLIYLIDFFLKVAYFQSSKFASVTIWEIYKNFLWFRPCIILVAHILKTAFDFDKWAYKNRQKKRSKTIGEKDEDV